MHDALVRRACYIDGRWVGAGGGRRIAVANPATGETIAHVPNCGEQEARVAIAAAERALPPWRATTAAMRGEIVASIGRAMLEHRDPLAELLTSEQGKPLAEARGEIAYAAGYFEWFAAEAVRVTGDILQAPTADQRVEVLREPIGVCAAITPWNFPSAMLARKIAPALAAGCTMVCKPSEETPLSALALAVLAERAGVPPGVVNVITGDPAPIGTAMMRSQAVRKVSFTGSTEVGKLLIEQSAHTVKKLSLELGGNAPFIVFDDADLDVVVRAAVATKYRASGQTCICANRFLVHGNIADELGERIVRASAQLVVGDGRVDGVDLGPLINAAAAAKVRRLVVDAIDGGARLIGGTLPTDSSLLFGPLVLADVTGGMAIAQEEIFGPVVCLRRCTSEAALISAANETRAGLAAYVFGRDAQRMSRVTAALEFGMVGVNEVQISNPAAPFGGIKESGYGREGGARGIDEYLRLKYVVSRLLSGRSTIL